MHPRRTRHPVPTKQGDKLREYVLLELGNSHTVAVRLEGRCMVSRCFTL